jgi:hypothetical protein
MKNKAGHPRTRPPPPSEDEKKRRRRASTERWHKKKFGRDRYPKRGRQPLDPKERKRRRGIATRKAAKKWRSKNRNKIAQYNQDHYARTHRKNPRHEIESLSDTMSAIRAMEITTPEYRRISAAGLSVYEPWEDPEQMAARMKLSGEIPCTPKELKQLQRNAAKKKGPNAKRKTPYSPTGNLPEI